MSMEKVYFSFDKEGYIDGYGSSKGKEEDIEVEIEENHPIFSDDIRSYKMKDGKLYKCPTRTKEIQDEVEREKNTPRHDDMISQAIMELAIEIEELKKGR